MASRSHTANTIGNIVALAPLPIDMNDILSAANGAEEDDVREEEEWDILAMINALGDSSKAGHSLPCDFYDKKTGFYTITII